MTRTPLANRSAGGTVGGPVGRCRLRGGARAGGPTPVGPHHRLDPGAPSWADLGTVAGTTAAATFYCGLFGWSVVATHRPLDDGVGHWTFRHDGDAVGAVAPAGEAAWTVYIAVTDVDAMATVVARHGGAVLAGPMAVGAGRVAVCADPAGAAFVMWAPDPEVSAGDGPAPSGSYLLATRDVGAAKAFYGAVFGWEAVTTRLEDGSTFTELLRPGSGRCVAEMVEVTARADAAAGWMVHLAVSDAARTAARAAELGGAVSLAPVDVPDVGRVAVLTDPEGAAFSVFEA